MKPSHVAIVSFGLLCLSIIGISDFEDSAQRWKWYAYIAATVILSVLMIGGIVLAMRNRKKG